MAPGYSKYFQTPKSVAESEEELRSYNDHKNLISTLPCKEGFFPVCIHCYRGFWFAEHLLLGLLSSRKHFKPFPDDIFLNTYPKSGTTWIKALAFAILNRRSFPCTDPNHPLLTTSPRHCVPFFEGVFAGVQVPDFAVLPRPRMFASHVPYSLLPDPVKDEGNIGPRIVYVCRDPKDVLVSILHFYNTNRGPPLVEFTIEKLFEDMISGSVTYGPIWEHQMEYKRESLRRPEKVLFLRYEEIRESPQENVRRLASFLGQPITTEEEEAGTVEEIVRLCSFEFLKELEVNKERADAESNEVWTAKNSSFLGRGRWEIGRSISVLTWRRKLIRL